MLSKIISYLHHQSFQPGLFSIFLNPFYFIRRSLYKEIKTLAPGLQGKLIDLGCGRKPYENLFSVSEYIGIDIEQSGHDHTLSKVDVFYDGKTIPFDKETFDSGFCSEVMEHVFNPDDVLVELNRVLKPNAKLLLTVPFCWNEHEVPYDYGRYTSFGLRYLLEKHGFTVIDIRKTGNFVRVVWQLQILYIFEGLKRFKKAGYVLALLLIVPLNILGLILLPLFPRNMSLFFNSVVLVKKNPVA